MRIQHNIMAMNAYRNYNINTKALSGNLEKLSSGYKINRAGDDAAGLAISEKMRAQITGLDAAQKNVKDGISLVKTAEGAMQEIQDMLNRMDYLATQSANGTYQNEVDRENLQKEVEALKTEINRIADSANFNGIKLLDGTQEKRSAGTKAVDSMERILSSVIGKDEKANEVSGEKTILDQGGGAAVKGVFTVDLNTLKFTKFGTSATCVAKGELTIGDKKFTLTSSAVAANATNATIIKAIATKVVAAGATTTINGCKWTVAHNNGVLTFTQKFDPASASQARTDFDVSFAMTNEAAATDASGIKLSDSHLHGTKTTTAANAAVASNRANTTFKITADDIKDGTTITIGKKTVTLAVGADSAYKNMATTASSAKVDLTTMEEGNIDLHKALSKISESFGTGNIKVEAKDNSGAISSLTVMVGVSDGANGNTVGLTVQRTQAIQTGTNANEFGIVFKSKEDLAKVFSLKVGTKAQSGLTLQIGDTADSFNQMNVSVKDMHTGSMGIARIDISTQTGAQAAVQTVRDAINYVSSVRGDLGAIQNRLDHTGNNLSVMAENIQDAESTIRDTDVAEEMMKYVKNNILVQSAQAMLAQANQVPQGVLQLLG